VGGDAAARGPAGAAARRAAGSPTARGVDAKKGARLNPSFT